MKTFYVAMMLTLLAGSAYAQTPSINLYSGDKVRTPEEREKDKAVNDAYKAQMSKIPDQKTSSDPWGTVRSADAPKAAPAARKKHQN
jgi:hypothetical protein